MEMKELLYKLKSCLHHRRFWQVFVLVIIVAVVLLFLRLGGYQIGSGMPGALISTAPVTMLAIYIAIFVFVSGKLKENPFSKLNEIFKAVAEFQGGQRSWAAFFIVLILALACIEACIEILDVNYVFGGFFATELGIAVLVGLWLFIGVIWALIEWKLMNLIFFEACLTKMFQKELNSTLDKLPEDLLKSLKQAWDKEAEETNHAKKINKVSRKFVENIDFELLQEQLTGQEEQLEAWRNLEKAFFQLDKIYAVYDMFPVDLTRLTEERSKKKHSEDASSKAKASLAFSYWMLWKHILSSSNERISLLKNQQFRDLDFFGVDFSKARLEGVCFSNCKFVRASFKDANLKTNKFLQCHFVEVDFDGAIIHDCTFQEGESSYFSDTTFKDAQISDVSFFSIGDSDALKKGLEKACIGSNVFIYRREQSKTSACSSL